MASSPVIIQVATPGPAGPAGPAGGTGAAGYSPQYIVAAGVPSSGVGLKGDMYINSTTSDVWGPKIDNTTWPATPACNIRGTTGATGYSPLYIVAAGAPAAGTGNNGDMYINSTTSDVYGPKASGVWGAIVCNIKGATGSQGPPGVGYTPMGAWSAATTYLQGHQVTDGGILYISLQSGNLNHVPASNPTWWQSVVSGGFSDPTTTKGDLVVRGATPPATRLGVGTNGQILIADSAQTLGVKWGATISQTPWTSDIDAAGFTLKNAGKIGIGVAVPGAILGVNQGAAAAVTHAIFSSPYANAGDYQQILFGYDQGATPGISAGIRAIRSVTASYGADLAIITSGLLAPGTVQERMRITAAGQVGIGTASPQAALNVAADAYRQLYLTGTDPSKAMRIGYDSSNNTAVVEGLLSGSGVPLLLNPSGGNVGIGTTAPTSKLSFGNINANVTSRIALYEGAAGISFRGIGMVHPSSVYGVGIWADSGATTPTDTNMHLFVQDGGNVGIGTAAPLHQLTVVGPGVNTSAINTAAAMGGALSLDDSGVGAGYGGAILFGAASGAWRFAAIKALATDGGSNTRGDLAICTRRIATDTTLTEVMRITAAGTVGIGKTSGYPLDVAGDVNCTGSFRVNGVPISTGGGSGVSVQTAGMAGSSRLIGNTYQNTFSGGKPVLVTVTCNCNAAGSFWANCNSTSSFGAGNQVAQTTSQNASQVLSITFWVLPNYFYAVSSSGSLTLTYWTEWY